MAKAIKWTVGILGVFVVSGVATALFYILFWSIDMEVMSVIYGLLPVLIVAVLFPKIGNWANKE